MIHQLTELTANSISIEVPEGATHIHVQDLRDWEFRFSYKLGEEWTHIPIDEYYKALGRGNELTEEQWKQIVEWFSILGDTGYQDYGKEYLSYGFGTAAESGQSLLKAKNVPIDRVIILIKQ
jgi:hypothetical protein